MGPFRLSSVHTTLRAMMWVLFPMVILAALAAGIVAWQTFSQYPAERASTLLVLATVGAVLVADLLGLKYLWRTRGDGMDKDGWKKPMSQDAEF